MSASRAPDLLPPLLERLRPKAKSLIVTIYGDGVLPHGGATWLGGLIKLGAPLGLNERIIRTSVFRLSKEDWLTSTQQGRRSYYSLTEAGRRRFEAAHRRIYSPQPQPWDGLWTLVLSGAAGLEEGTRDALRRDLNWLGFGQLAPGVALHPAPDVEALRQALTDVGAQDHVAILRATLESWVGPAAARGLVDACWELDKLAAEYQTFLDAFTPVWRALDGTEDPPPELCFALRTLLIHGYRRALLRDPMLPEELLPPDWPGAAARLLCRNLYRLIHAAADRHLMATLETPVGPPPEAGPSYYARFGGL